MESKKESSQNLKMESKKASNQESLVEMLGKAFENATRKRTTVRSPESPAILIHHDDTRNTMMLPSVRSLLLHPSSSTDMTSRHVGDGKTSQELITSTRTPCKFEDSFFSDSPAQKGLLVADIRTSLALREGIIMPQSEMEPKIPKMERRHHISQKAQTTKQHHTDTMNTNHQQQSPNPAERSPQKSYSSYSPVMGQQGGGILTDSNSYGTRPRSRAIAIKRTRRCAEEVAASQNEESNEKMYDWATWRMYNRIVDHRRNQNLGVPGPLPVSTSHLKRNNDQEDSAGDSASLLPTQLLDGEIFHLEI